MSFGGHALDALKRIQYNRALKQMRRIRYNEMKEAVSKFNAKYHKFKDKSQLTPEELEVYKKKIRQKIKRDKQKNIIISVFTTLVILCIICLTSVFLINYFLSN